MLEKLMIQKSPEDYSEVLTTISNWTADTRRKLVRDVLMSLSARESSSQENRTADQFIGLGTGSSTPPDDETIDQWIQEHRIEKYG
ncbi:MAG: hypothetical protein CMJ78_04560 [Planctomycetaceae bacterium]|nr:hypothetical protein [Planctomycetaceae bacterium]